MANQKPAEQKEDTLVISGELLKDSALRSQPLNTLKFDTASTDNDVDETNEEEESGTSVNDEEEANKDDETDEDETLVQDEDDGEKVKAKGSKGLEKKFKKLTSERTQLKEQNAQLMERLERLEQQVKGTSPKKDEPKTSSDFNFDKPKPNIDDFNSVGDYYEALSDWKLDYRQAKDKAEQQVNDQKQSGEKTLKEFIAKGKSVEKDLGLTKGEWEATVRDEDFKLSTGAYLASTELEDNRGAQILYEIASDDALRDKFNSLNERQQVAFIGKLDAKFDIETESKTKGGNGLKVTKAKPPGKAIKGSANTIRFDRSKPVNELASEFNNIKSQSEYKRLRKSGML